MIPIVIKAFFTASYLWASFLLFCLSIIQNFLTIFTLIPSYLLLKPKDHIPTIDLTKFLQYQLSNMNQPLDTNQLVKLYQSSFAYILYLSQVEKKNINPSEILKDIARFANIYHKDFYQAYSVVSNHQQNIVQMLTINE
jgi:hypothetical protein